MKKKTIQPFYQILRDSVDFPRFDEFIAAIKNPGHYWLSGLVGSSKALFLAHLYHQEARPLLVVTNDVDSAENLVDDLTTFLGPDAVTYFPGWEITPYDGRSPHEGVLGVRLESLYQMMENQSLVWVTSVKSLMRQVPTPDFLRESITKLKKGESYDLGKLERRLIEIGYRRERKVEDLNSFAVRGDILDIFTYAQRNPVRIEFWGDTIEDIRRFDVYTQRSIQSIPEVVVLPAAELILRPDQIEAGLAEIKKRKLEIENNIVAHQKAFQKDDTFALEEEADRLLEVVDGDPDLVIDKIREKIPFEGEEEYLPYFIPQMTTLFEYLPKNAYVVFDERGDIFDAAQKFDELIQQQFIKTNAMRRPMPQPERVFISPNQMSEMTASRVVIDLTLLHIRPEVGPITHHERLEIKGQAATGGHMDKAAEMLSDLIRNGYKITIFADNRGQMERFKQMLEEMPFI